MTYEDQILITKSEYDGLKGIAFRYNYLIKLMLKYSKLDNHNMLDFDYDLDRKTDDFLTLLEPMLFEEWKGQQPKEEE